MQIRHAFDKFAVSFEVFPPKTETGIENLFTELTLLKKFNPAYVSVTYGAGGSTREKTIDISIKIKESLSIEPLMHFTCVGNSRYEVAEHLEKVKSLGLTNILALRGDPPAGATDFVPAEDGFAYASELIKFIKSNNGFSIAAAGYPEKHPDAPSIEEDIRHLKEKTDAGAEIIITQLFLENDKFLRFRDLCAKEGIAVKIIPGIMPVVTLPQIERMVNLSGVILPRQMDADIKKANGDADIIFQIGVEYASAQVENLMLEGVPGFHFYPLNKARAISEVIENSGILK